MLNIAALYPAHNEPRPLAKIRRFACPFEIGFALIAGLIGLFTTIVFALAFTPFGPFVFISPEGGWVTTNPANLPDGAVAIGDLSLSAKIVGGVAALFIQGAQILSFVFLSRLFGIYRRGVVFGKEPISAMRRAGITLIIAGLAPGLMQPFVRLSGALDENWLHSGSVAFLLAGGALFLFAHITVLGMELEQENKGFV